MLTRPWPSGAVLFATLLGAASLDAQVSVSADATVATVRYNGFLRSGVLLLTPVARVDYPLFSLTGRGTFSRFESGNHSTDLVVAASVFTPRLNAWQAELTADGGISHYLQSNNGYGSVGARLHRTGARSGFWLGGERVSVTTGTTPDESSRREIGTWARTGPFALSFAVTRTKTREVVSDETGNRTEHVAYYDAGAHARWEREWLQLTASLGARAGDPIIGARQWGDVSATMWLNRRLAIVLGHGTYPVDLAQRAPGGRYSALSMRIATRPPALRDALARSVRLPTPSLVRPVVASFDAKRNRDGTVRIRVRAPGASSVELVGDFSDWDPLSLERTVGDTWQIVLPLASGTHRLNIRVDGGEWGVPPGIGTKLDEFGEVVGLLLIS